jgi:hypothetical protein
MTPGEPPESPAPDDTLTRVFSDCLAAVHAGSPALLLLTGEAASVRNALAAIATDAPVSRTTRIVDVEPVPGTRFDPVDALARSWKRGARRVTLDDRQRDLAWNWLGLIPFWGNLVAAVYETVTALRRDKANVRDRALRPLLRAHRQRTLVAVLFDLHTADRAAAARLCSAVLHAPAGSRLLVLGGAPETNGARAPILEMSAQLPPDRLVVHRLVRHDVALERLARLSPAAADAIRSAARIGFEFDGVTLARVLGQDELAVEDRLAIAARAGLIRTIGTRDLPGGDVASLYRFESEALRIAIVTAAVP